jgi:hypothetical protein
VLVVLQHLLGRQARPVARVPVAQAHGRLGEMGNIRYSGLFL